MKSANKVRDKKRKGIQKPKIKPKKEKVLIVAQEIKFARLLSGNEKKTRDRVLKSFKKWLLSCFDRGHEFKEDDFIRVWKGLFYAVWMSDKPLVQEELCETIAGILDLFPPKQVEYAFLMFKAGFKVLATEWYGIDHHRMDKFLMLVRRYLRGSLRCVARCKWKTDVCKMYADTLAGTDGILSLKTPLYARNAGSMLLHVVDCFLEEISKVSEGSVPDAGVVELLRPVCAYMVCGSSPPLCVAARRLLTQLLRQSDRGLEYRERTRAWEQMGCPRGGPDALEPASDDDDDADAGDQDHGEEPDEGEKALDPRAGRVDVTLHPVPVPAAGLADVLRQLLAGASSKAHKRTKICLQRFEALAKDEYPLRVADVRPEAGAVPRRRSAAALRTLEKTLLASADELALRGLSRKHRKRLLAKSRAGRSIVADVAPPQADITSTNGDWAVEATVSKTDKKTDKHTDKANKENVNKEKSKKRNHADAQTDRLGKRNRNNTKEQKLSKDRRTDKKVAVVGDNKTVNSNKKDKLKETDSKPPAVEKAKTVNSKKDDKTKQTDKPVTAKQNSLMNGVVGKPKSEKANRNGLTRESKNVNVSKQKFSKKESIKDKNKILNGRVEKTQQDKVKLSKKVFETPKKVKFVLKNNCMQGTVDYYKSVRQSPSIPFDGAKKPSKTNLKVSTPSPINPFFKKKLRMK